MDKQYYARHKHDLIIHEMLGNKKNGFYVDIGATDGITNNNTALFEIEHQWSGICIEPDSINYSKLIHNRKCQCFNICVGKKDQNGVVQFNEDNGNHELSSISKGAKKYIACLDLTTILRDMNIYHVDFLSIDTEGNELNIIKDIDFDLININIICYEHNDHMGKQYRDRKKEIERILMLEGFTHTRDLDTDSIFLKDV